jgi:YHS domain-containing protein
MKKIIITSVIVLAVCFPVAAQQSPVFIHSGKAIRGYDPVSYFIDGKPLPGKEELTYKWNNADWYFSDQQHLDSFKVNPEKYIPQYGGYCAYGMYEGHKAPTDPNAWTIVNGKLYFNYNLKVRELWKDKREEKIEAADKNWPAVKDKE